MAECTLVVDAKPIQGLGVEVGETAPPLVADARAIASGLVADARAIASGITTAVRAVPAQVVQAGARGPITAGVAERPTLVVEVGGCMALFLNGMERGAERARRDLKKLAAYTTSINVPGTSPVEMPTGLVLYPSFRDSGFLEFNLGGAHANMNGETVTIALMLGPAGSLAQVATITSPPINPTSAVGNFQFEFFLRLKSQGPTSHNFSGYFAWNDASGPQLSPIIGRLVTTGAYTGFGDPGNGDEGDVEVRVDVSLSASGPTLNVRNYVIEQHSPRSLSQ